MYVDVNKIKNLIKIQYKVFYFGEINMFKEIFLRIFLGFLIIRDFNYRIIFINDNLKNLIKSYM